MKRVLKKYFIPHHENNFHPHILHTKRTVFYGAVFFLTKIFIVVFAVFLPVEVFVLPDVLAEEQRKIIELTNEARDELGRSYLFSSDKLNQSAQFKSDDMAENEYFAHTHNQMNVSGWLRKAGYQFYVAGENLAVGFTTAEEIVEAWKNSPTHYANLIDTDFKNVGVGLSGGIFEGQPVIFIAQHLAAPKLVAVINPKKTEKLPEESVSSTSVLGEKTVQLAEPVLIPVTSTEKVKFTGMVVNAGAPTPIDKYIKARSILSPITNIFNVSRNIYLGAMIFFAVTLAINIFIEVRKQHPHVIVEVGGLVALLFIFWKF